MTTRKNQEVSQVLKYILIGFLFVGCTAKITRQETVMDTPAHHVKAGMSLFDEGQYEKAVAEFERALSLDSNCSQAYSGKGLSLAAMGRFDDAFDAMKTAEARAESVADKMNYRTGMMRIYMNQHSNGWIKKVEAHFSKASRLDERNPAPFYYMAMAYKKSGRYGDASACFQKVLELDRGYIECADTGWDSTQQIQRSMSGIKMGKDIAGIDAMTRADIAALFVEQMNMDVLFRSRERVKKIIPENSGQEITDYQDHVLKSDIEKIISLGLRGLEPVGNRFQPDREVCRADFALMIEDILVMVTGEDDIPVRFISAATPFKDIDSSHYAYNAVMTCTTRGIMDADIEGFFEPCMGVSGGDALMSLRRLKIALERNGYQSGCQVKVHE